MKSKNLLKQLFSWRAVFPPKSSSRWSSPILKVTWRVVVFTVFSGAIRKWMIGPGAISNVIFSLQLIVPVVFFIVAARQPRTSRGTLPVIFTTLCFYMVVCALNPMNETFFHGLFGLILHLSLFLCWTAYYYRKDLVEIEKLIPLFVIVLVLECLLGSAQYNLPGDHVLNKFSTGEVNTASVGNAIRASGTFSFVGGFQALVVFYGFLTWFLLVRNYPPYFVLSVFALTFFAALISGSRGSMATILLISLFAFISSGFLARRFISLAITLSLLTFAIFYFGQGAVVRFSSAYDNFRERIELGQQSGELEYRLSDVYNDLVDFRGKYPIMGVGLGSTYQGANILFGESLYVKEYGYYESELGRVLLEGGYILLVLRVLAFIVLLRFSSIPVSGKFLLFVLFINNMVVFNIYLVIFFSLGFILVDRGYYLNQIDLAKGTHQLNY